MKFFFLFNNHKQELCTFYVPEDKQLKPPLDNVEIIITTKALEHPKGGYLFHFSVGIMDKILMEEWFKTHKISDVKWNRCIWLEKFEQRRMCQLFLEI